MKKILVNITYLVLSAMLVTYMLIDCVSSAEGGRSILYVAANTGLSVVGFLLLFPLFVLSIIALCKESQKVAFTRDVICLFSSLFILAATIIVLVSNEISNLYVPIIIFICLAIILIGSTISIIKVVINEDREKKALNTKVIPLVKDDENNE